MGPGVSDWQMECSQLAASGEMCSGRGLTRNSGLWRSMNFGMMSRKHGQASAHLDALLKAMHAWGAQMSITLRIVSCYRISPSTHIIDASLSSADGDARWATDRERSPRSEVNCTVTHCIYENLWYNNGRFYLLVDGPHPVVRAR